MNEGHRVLRHVRKLLRIPQLELKEDPHVHRLSAGAIAQLLGFKLWRTRRGKLGVGIANDAIIRLRENLEESHREPDPVATARAVLRGWVNSMGPAFRSGRNRLPETYRITAELGLSEAIAPGELEQWWHASWTRWCKTTMAARERHAGDRGREVVE